MTLEQFNADLTRKGYEFQMIHGAPPTRLVIGTSEDGTISSEFRHRSNLFNQCGHENTRRQYRGLKVFVVDAATFFEVL